MTTAERCCLEPKGLCIFTTSKGKVEGVNGLSSYLGGLEAPVVFDGVSNEEERQLEACVLKMYPNLSSFDIPMYVAGMKLKAAEAQGLIDLETPTGKVNYANDTVRKTLDGRTLPKPSNEQEALKFLQIISRNVICDVVGSAFKFDGDDHMHGHTLVAVTQFHEIPQNVMRDIAQDPQTLKVAGGLRLLADIPLHSGLGMIRSNHPTELWAKEAGGNFEHIGIIPSGKRLDTKVLTNIVKCGGWPLGEYLERFLNAHRSPVQWV